MDFFLLRIKVPGATFPSGRNLELFFFSAFLGCGIFVVSSEWAKNQIHERGVALSSSCFVLRASPVDISLLFHLLQFQKLTFVLTFIALCSTGCLLLQFSFTSLQKSVQDQRNVRGYFF